MYYNLTVTLQDLHNGFTDVIVSDGSVQWRSRWGREAHTIEISYVVDVWAAVTDCGKRSHHTWSESPVMSDEVVFVDQSGTRHVMPADDTVRVYTRTEESSSDVHWLDPEDLDGATFDCTVGELREMLLAQRRYEREHRPSYGKRYVKRYYVCTCPTNPFPIREHTYFYLLDVTDADVEGAE